MAERRDPRDTFGLGVASWGGLGKEHVDRQDPCWQERLPFERVRRTKLYKKYVEAFVNRRAFSEVELLEALSYEDFKQGCVYNFLTDGDVDALSYLKAIVNRHQLNELLIATWCISGLDWLTLAHWVEEGRIGRLAMRLSFTYPSFYPDVWQRIKTFIYEHKGRCEAKCVKSHGKVMAGANEAEGFYFTAQGSANFNTNPRVENCCLQFDKGRMNSRGTSF
ncbi:MAG: hypothetical protein LUC33_04775 [Prevotellaceae bacterium]|nr:hypothetical protein [Prevotellaceae bacterium]